MTSITLTRTLAASPSRVWRALTTEEFGAWMWPPRFETTCVVDAQLGGSFRLSSEIAGMAVSGDYIAVEPESRLVQTWKWDGDDEETLVTITLEPAREGTLLTIVHERFGTPEDAASHEQGWNDCLDRIPDYLAG